MTASALRRSGVLVALGFLLVATACSKTEDASSSSALPTAHTVSVHGTGTVRVEPDVLDVVFAAEGNDLTAKGAYDEMASASAAIAKLAKDADIDKKDIQSSQVYLSPTYDYNNGTARITGYTASITVTVRLRKPENASALLDKAASTVGNALRLRGITWTVDDPSKALEDARSAAMQDAKSRAETLAKSGGVDLGKVLSIVESSQNVSPPVYEGGSKDESAAPGISVEPGTEAIVVNVDVVYELN